MDFECGFLGKFQLFCSNFIFKLLLLTYLKCQFTKRFSYYIIMHIINAVAMLMEGYQSL